jgi:hypothetical protein
VVLSPAFPAQILGLLDAVQLVALLEVNEMLAADPLVILIGPSELLALIFTVGGWFKFTVTESDAVPPGPVQTNV